MYKLLLIFFIFLSCATNFNNSIRSNDINFILMVISHLSNEKKYEDILVLYEKLIPLVTFDKKLLFYAKYKLAETNFKLNNYSLAASQFKEIYIKFQKNKQLENVLYFYAISCYKDCKSFNLDLSKTLKAINEMQYFINVYPNSNKLVYANEIIQKLYKKLEKKSYYNALSLYKMNKYESSIVAFSNMLIDFPDSKMREKVYYYIILSKYNLIRKSISKVEQENIDDVKNFIMNFLEQFPNSYVKNRIQKIKINIDNFY